MEQKKEPILLDRGKVENDDEIRAILLEYRFPNVKVIEGENLNLDNMRKRIILKALNKGKTLPQAAALMDNHYSVRSLHRLIIQWNFQRCPVTKEWTEVIIPEKKLLRIA